MTGSTSKFINREKFFPFLYSSRDTGISSDELLRFRSRTLANSFEPPLVIHDTSSFKYKTS